jgi:hypothetical protein
LTLFPSAQNKEEKEEKNKELVGGFEPMTNVHPGVKMATAVNAFRFENNGFKPLGRLGLAIIGWYGSTMCVTSYQ